MSFPVLNGELSLAGLGWAGWLAHLLEHFNSATIRLHRNGMGSFHFSEAYEKFIRYSICLEVYINIDTIINDNANIGIHW